MSNITSFARLGWFRLVVWCCNVQNITLDISTGSSNFLDDKIYGFCKVLSEGHFRSFYAILENDDFHNMKIKTYMNLKCDNDTF